jgi:hypothetical protein
MSYTDEEYHGRVQSMTMMSWSLFGIAALPIGIIADHIGIRETLGLLGGLAAVLVVVNTLIGRAQGAERDRVTAATAVRTRAHAGGGGGS